MRKKAGVKKNKEGAMWKINKSHIFSVFSCGATTVCSSAVVAIVAEVLSKLAAHKTWFDLAEVRLEAESSA